MATPARRGSTRAGRGPAARRARGAPRVLGEQGERTRQRLLDAARKVFRERTYPETRVDDITREAGTSHGAFYLYFANKAELLEALAAETADRMYALADRLEPMEPGEEGFRHLCRWIDEFIDAYREDAPVILAWMTARPQDERFDRLGREVLAKLAGRIARTIREAVHQGDRHPIHAGIAATALIAMLERFCYFWLVRGGADLRRADVVETLAAIWHQGIFGQSHHD
jgi:AcrR family transcriptional regulator